MPIILRVLHKIKDKVSWKFMQNCQTSCRIVKIFAGLSNFLQDYKVEQEEKARNKEEQLMVWKHP